MKVKTILISWLILILVFLFFLALRFDLIRQKLSAYEYAVRPLSAITKADLPSLTAKSYLIIDSENATVLAEKNPHLRLHPASITKMVTAISALESYPLGEVVTVKQEYPVGKNMGLEAREKITVENLIYGLLVHSANDAAYVLAGQSQKNVEQFVKRMNNFIEQLGLNDTHFVNFDGEEDKNHYSTSFDLAHLARFALKNKVFEQAIRKEKMEVTDLSGEIVHQLETTNELLGEIPEVKGIKTGWTPQSGECFIGLIEVDEKQLITVILGSEDRFGETKMLIDWIKKVYSRHSGGIAG
jgi:D-alanyl-D-alanine carboxypeptidase (penicillin-binding protein 5/6)